MPDTAILQAGSQVCLALSFCGGLLLWIYVNSELGGERAYLVKQ